MPRRDTAPLGAPCWIDLSTSDPDRAQEFYRELFGWAAESAGEEYGGYLTFSRDGEPVAGGMKNDGQSGSPDRWGVYLASANAHATVDAAAANGGSVVYPVMQVGPLGAMAIIRDAGDALIGVWQPGLHQGFTVLGEPGTPGWFELHTYKYDAVVPFYRDVFGWDAHAMSDTPQFRYTTLGEGDDALAGIMDASGLPPEGVSADWQIYFAVQDADAALAKVTEMGGTVLRPAEDTPFGRLAQAADPTGATFKIVAG